MDGDGLDALRELGTPEELESEARRDLEPAPRPRVNSHIHLPPNFSAFDSVEQAVSAAAAEGVRVLGVSNYYDYTVYHGFIEEAARRGVFPLFGIEIIVLNEDLAARGIRVNDPKNPGKMYLCGKGLTGFSDLTPEARRILDLIRRKDSLRMAQMVDKMGVHFANHNFETGLNEAAVIAAVTRRHGAPPETVVLQERHVAQAFQEWLFDNVPPAGRGEALALLFGPTAAAPPPRADDHVAVQNALRDQLMKAGKPAYAEETFIDYPQARRLILEMGGIPCYPTLADGAAEACEFETPIPALLDELERLGIAFAEFIPTRNTPEVLARYAAAMRERGIVVTAGTEHNTLALDPLEPTCVGGTPIPEALKELFWEGACVIAAHQLLRLHGRPGYVDSEGALNPSVPDRESRIRAFRALGAAAIRRYLLRA